jgi:hypothetical protein
MIRRHIICPNNQAHGERLRHIIDGTRRAVTASGSGIGPMRTIQIDAIGDRVADLIG